MGCVFPMVIVSILPHVAFGPNYHREDALHFTECNIINIKLGLSFFAELKNSNEIIAFKDIVEGSSNERYQFSSLLELKLVQNR